MNASLRSLLLMLLLLLMLPSTEAFASGGSRQRGSKASRYSIVETYKDAYAKPRAKRGLFGKRKLASYRYARTHRTNS